MGQLRLELTQAQLAGTLMLPRAMSSAVAVIHLAPESFQILQIAGRQLLPF